MTDNPYLRAAEEQKKQQKSGPPSGGSSSFDDSDIPDAIKDLLNKAEVSLSGGSLGKGGPASPADQTHNKMHEFAINRIKETRDLFLSKLALRFMDISFQRIYNAKEKSGASPQECTLVVQKTFLEYYFSHLRILDVVNKLNDLTACEYTIPNFVQMFEQALEKTNKRHAATIINDDISLNDEVPAHLARDFKVQVATIDHFIKMNHAMALVQYKEVCDALGIEVNENRVNGLLDDQAIALLESANIEGIWVRDGGRILVADIIDNCARELSALDNTIPPQVRKEELMDLARTKYNLPV